MVRWPYETQDANLGDRSCGAAAMSMVYRSLGLACTQTEVWPHIAQRGADGQWRASTHLLARDAGQRGLAALVLRAGHPWRLLEQCLAHEVRAILNHRPTVGASNGHYSLLLDLTPRHIVLHDPALGPERRYGWEDFLQMWRKSWPWSEVAGNVLVAISTKADGGKNLPNDLPRERPCPRCRRLIHLQPACLLVGVSAARAWEALFCPECDAAITQLKPDLD